MDRRYLWKKHCNLAGEVYQHVAKDVSVNQRVSDFTYSLAFAFGGPIHAG